LVGEWRLFGCAQLPQLFVALPGCWIVGGDHAGIGSTRAICERQARHEPVAIALDHNGQPRAVKATVDRRDVHVCLAAISIAAPAAISAGQLRVVPNGRMVT
jgi:hypothetical protein